MSASLRSTVVALPRLPAGWQLVTAAVLADGKLALLATDVDLAHEWRRDPDGRVLGKPREVAARATARLWGFAGETLEEGPSFPLERPFLQIDRFDDGRWLAVVGRTENEPNARVLAPDGHLLACFMLGDGIEHAGVDRHDRIWVGWFDEGVFGNDEWRVPDEEWPPSHRGIGVFSADGDYQPLPAFPERAGIIADSYALNIADDGAWVCPYTDFPLLHLQPGRPVRWWSNEMAGPMALAVSGGHLLLAGGYGANADRLTLVTLEGDGNGEAARILAMWRLPLVPHRPQPGEPPPVAEHHPWEYPTLLDGRGDTIHMIQDGAWHRWRVSDAVLACRDMGDHS